MLCLQMSSFLSCETLIVAARQEKTLPISSSILCSNYCKPIGVFGAYCQVLCSSTGLTQYSTTGFSTSVIVLPVL